MNIAGHMLSGGWAILSALLFAGVLAWALRSVAWRRFAGSRQVNVWGAAVVSLALLWSMKAGVDPGLDLHLIGAMAMVLAFGPRLALIGLALVLAAVTLNGGGDWVAYPLNALVLAALPVAVAYTIFRAVERWLPNHLFVYIFVNGFIGAAVVVGLTGIVASSVLWLLGAYAAEHLATQYLPYFLLLGFSEAWLTGMVVTLMVVYRPEWVSTFDDARYLLNK